MTEPLAIDSLQLETLRQEYDYDSQVVKSGRSYLELLAEAVNKLMRSIFGSETYQNNSALIWTLIGVALILAVVVIVIVKKPQLFLRGSKKGKKTAYSVSEDTIYGIDFDSGISKAKTEGNYREAVRLIYLKTLRLLSDKSRIDWQPFKTPSQYTREYADTRFRTMTNHFLRVRYGDFAADGELCDTVESLASGIAARLGGSSDNDNKQSTAP